MPSSPGSSTVARAARPGTRREPTSASRSIACDSRRRRSESASGPSARTGTSPNRPEAGSKRSALRGSFTRWAKRRSAKVPPSTRSALPPAKAVTACSAPAPASSTSSWRFGTSSSDATSRVSRSSPPGPRPAASRNGPVPVPLRTIANSGWASRVSRLGRGAVSWISITRSVIATMSWTAPKVSFSELALDPAIDRLRNRATCRAVTLPPVGQSTAAMRKM